MVPKTSKVMVMVNMVLRESFKGLRDYNGYEVRTFLELIATRDGL